MNNKLIILWNTSKSRKNSTRSNGNYRRLTVKEKIMISASGLFLPKRRGTRKQEVYVPIWRGGVKEKRRDILTYYSCSTRPMIGIFTSTTKINIIMLKNLQYL